MSEMGDVAGILSTVAALATAIDRLVSTSSEHEKLEALQAAAEAVKTHMDALKFPNESNE